MAYSVDDQVPGGTEEKRLRIAGTNLGCAFVHSHIDFLAQIRHLRQDDPRPAQVACERALMRQDFRCEPLVEPGTRERLRRRAGHGNRMATVVELRKVKDVDGPSRREALFYWCQCVCLTGGLGTSGEIATDPSASDVEGIAPLGCRQAARALRRTRYVANPARRGPPDVFVPSSFPLGRSFISFRKANTALKFRMPSGQISAAMKSDPRVAAKYQADAGDYITFAGGLPLFEGRELIGALGVSGAEPSAQDEACAKAAARSVGLEY